MGVRRRARIGALAALLGAAGAAGACVKIDLAPTGGVASAQLDPAPPSIALGDSLRDSLGVAVRVSGHAYDVARNVIPTAAFRYSYVPFTPDTTSGAVVDTALVVDSITGAVRATRTWLKSGTGLGISSGRVFARIGAGLQLADTIQIVPPPDSLAPTAVVDTLRFDCTDPGIAIIPNGKFPYFNAVGPFSVVVRGDSLGTSVPVRRWLVRWSVDSVIVANAVKAIPTVTLASGAKVPAIAIISNGLDQVINYDTTDASGTSNVRLRIRPSALGNTFSGSAAGGTLADTLFRATLRADVIAGVGTGGALHVLSARGGRVFSVLLSRHSLTPLDSATGLTCQR